MAREAIGGFCLWARIAFSIAEFHSVTASPEAEAAMHAERIDRDHLLNEVLIRSSPRSPSGPIIPEPCREATYRSHGLKSPSRGPHDESVG